MNIGIYKEKAIEFPKMEMDRRTFVKLAGT